MIDPDVFVFKSLKIINSFEDYSFYFTTTYNPLYSSIRKLRLEVGAFISNVPDDTVNLAIFEACREHLTTKSIKEVTYDKHSPKH